MQSYDRAKAALAAGEEELISADYANRLLNGENPLRVYRDLHAMTQAALTEKAGVNRVTVAEIETGRKQGAVATVRALADALWVSMDVRPASSAVQTGVTQVPKQPLGHTAACNERQQHLRRSCALQPENALYVSMLPNRMFVASAELLRLRARVKNKRVFRPDFPIPFNEPGIAVWFCTKATVRAEA